MNLLTNVDFLTLVEYWHLLCRLDFLIPACSCPSMFLDLACVELSIAEPRKPPGKRAVWKSMEKRGFRLSGQRRHSRYARLAVLGFASRFNLGFGQMTAMDKNIPPDRKPRARFHFFSAEFGFRYSETVILKSQKQPKNGSTFGGFFYKMCVSL